MGFDNPTEEEMEYWVDPPAHDRRMLYAEIVRLRAALKDVASKVIDDLHLIPVINKALDN